MDCLRNKESNWNQINSKILKSLDTGVSKKKLSHQLVVTFNESEPLSLLKVALC